MPPIKFKPTIGPVAMRAASVVLKEALPTTSALKTEVAPLGRTTDALMNLATAIEGNTAARAADTKALALRQATARAVTDLVSPPAALPKLDPLAPGQPKAWAPSSHQALPDIVWPESPSGLQAALVAHGYTVTTTDGLSKIYAKDAARLTVTEMKLANTEGYTIGHGQTQHVQLGPLQFEPQKWVQLQHAYTRIITGYNAMVDRPVLMNRSPLPRDGSRLHGPQDGLKHLLNLGGDLDELTARRADQQELAGIEKTISQRLELAAQRGTLPKKVIIAVEGLDGASKTGNGLAIARAFEKHGYEVRVKPFRAPTAEERARGIAGRYEDHAEIEDPSKRYVIMYDRAWPGDFVHNPSADVKTVVSEMSKFERRERANGAMFIKMLFEPGEIAPMETFGKRLARAAVANDFRQRRADLTEAELASVNEATTLVPGFGDFRSGTTEVHKATTARYRQVTEADTEGAPWLNVVTDNRHEGRVDARKALLSLFDDYEARLAAKP